MVHLCDAVACIEDDVACSSLDERRAGVAGEGVIPTVRTKEGDLHGYMVVRLLVSRCRFSVVDFLSHYDNGRTIVNVNGDCG